MSSGIKLKTGALIAFYFFALITIEEAIADSLPSNTLQQTDSAPLDELVSDGSSENTDEELDQDDEEPDCD